MDISISEAKGKLTDLVRRAEAGEQVTLTRRGAPVAVLRAVRNRPSPEVIMALIESVQAEARETIRPMPFELFDDAGLPC